MADDQAGPPADHLTAGDTERDAYLDNARFLLVLLVVVGHAIRPVIDLTLAGRALYFTIFAFHIPALVFLSGYLTKTSEVTPAVAKNLARRLLVPYVIFEVGYAYFRSWVLERDLRITIHRPFFLLWFLVALAAWRLLLPLFMAARWPFLVAVGLSLLAGYATPTTRVLSFNRIFALVPFFIAGHLVRGRWSLRAVKPQHRIAAVVTLLAGLVAAWLASPNLDKGWLYWTMTFKSLGVQDLAAPLGRLAVIAVAFVLTAAFLALVPHRKTFFTDLGRYTLYPFLLHGFVVKSATWDGAYVGLDTWPETGVVVFLAVLLMFLLSAAPVRFITRWAVEPSWIITPFGRRGRDRQP